MDRGEGYVSDNIHSERLLADVEAAYFAGFVDGEGTITVVRSAAPSRRSGWRYHACFAVANSDVRVLSWLREVCGNGYVRSNFHRKVHEHHRPVYQLRFTPHQIRHLLPQLLPYLIVKAEQAQLLMEFLELTQRADGAARSDEYWKRLESLRCQLSSLNPRGNVAAKKPEMLPLRPSRQGVNQWTKRESPDS